MTNLNPSSGQEPRLLSRRQSDYAIIAFVFFTPFTWSYLTVVSGFLVRPVDIVAICLVLLTLVSRKVSLPSGASLFYSCWIGLLVWLLINAFFTGETIALITWAKILFYGISTIALSNLIIVSGYYVSSQRFLIFSILLGSYIFLSGFGILGFFAELLQTATANPIVAFNRFWNSVFSVNFFGPSGRIEVVGVSFRNTAGLGFLAIALMTYGIVERGKARTIVFQISMILVVLLLSRTAIAAAAVALIFIVLSSPTKGRVVIVALAVSLTVVLLSFSFVGSALETRFSGGLGDRGQMNLDGLDYMWQAPMFGKGSNASVEHHLADRNVHNVVLALGASFGLPAFLFASGLMIFNFWSFFAFISRWHKCRDRAMRRIYAMGIGAAFVVSTRPMLSASAENFYSAAEWACLSLVIACHSLSSSQTQLKQNSA